MTTTTTLSGGEWLLRATDERDIFTPERMSDEQHLIERTVSEFVTNEVRPAIHELERKLGEQQEVLMHLADIVIDAYSAESALLRATAAANTDATALHADAVRVVVDEASPRIERSARQALAIMLHGESLQRTVNGLRRQFESTPIDLAAPRRRLADEAVRRGAYIFQR